MVNTVNFNVDAYHTSPVNITSPNIMLILSVGSYPTEFLYAPSFELIPQFPCHGHNIDDVDFMRSTLGIVSLAHKLITHLWC